MLVCFLACEPDEPPRVPAEAALPMVTLTAPDSIPTTGKVAGTLLLPAGTTYPIRLERRGGFSIGFPKHSYELDLEEDVPLLGLAADDDWILNANYIDKTFLRHVLSYDLFRRMGPNNRAAATAFTEVTLNDGYAGLYVLMEKVDRSVLEVNKRDTAAFIFKEPHVFRPSYEGITPRDPANFHQQTFPKIDRADRRAPLERLRALLLEADDATFDAELPRQIDVPNFVDWHLLLLLTNNADGILKNYYLYRKDKDTPIRVAPWDYDHSFGRDGDNERNLNERPLDASRSILFRRLLERPWYRDALKARWSAVQENGLFSVPSLLQRIELMTAEIADAATQNFERWPVDGRYYYDAATFTEELTLMREFVVIRHAYVSDYLADLP